MSLLWVIVILLAVNAATITAMLLVRRRAPEGSYFTDGDRASGVFGVLAGGFAIFAGFIIFLAFTSYDQSRSGGETEALTVIQQFETAELLPPAIHGRLTGELVCYGRSVVRREWAQMEEGKGGDTIKPLGGRAVPEPEGHQPDQPQRAERAFQVARPDVRPRAGAKRSPPRRRGHHPELDLARPVPDRGRRVRLHAVLRRPRRGFGLAGDADGISNHGDRAHPACDQCARQPVPRRRGPDQAGRDGAVAAHPGERTLDR